MSQHNTHQFNSWIQKPSKLTKTSLMSNMYIPFISIKNSQKPIPYKVECTKVHERHLKNIENEYNA